MKKNILLIGGSHGIGLSLAKQLQQDHTLYIASRTIDQLKDIDAKHINFDATSDEMGTSALPDELQVSHIFRETSI